MSYLSREYAILDSGMAQTWDREDLESPYKCLPDDKEYLRYVIRWMEVRNKRAFYKSRKVRLTLTVSLRHFFDAMLQDGAEVICLSDKAEKSEHNLGRMLCAYDHLPTQVKKWCPMSYTKGTSGDPRMMRFQARPPLFDGDVPFHGSKVEALASGADKVQEYHPSHWFWDQIESTIKALDTYMALMAVVNRNTQVTIVGTVLPGVWQDICYDRLGG